MLPVNVGADQHLAALEVFRQTRIDRRAFLKALHHVIEHRAAILVVEQLCIDEIIVDALGGGS